MIDNYNGGYKKALLDIYMFINDWEDLDKACRSKKQYKAMINSLLKTILTDPIQRENFQDGLIQFKVNPHTMEIIEIKRK